MQYYFENLNQFLPRNPPARSPQHLPAAEADEGRRRLHVEAGGHRGQAGVWRHRHRRRSALGTAEKPRAFRRAVGAADGTDDVAVGTNAVAADRDIPVVRVRRVLGDEGTPSVCST